MATAFLSHAAADSSFADMVIAALARDGWHVHTMRDLRPGIEISSQIERMADTADCVIVLWSVATAAASTAGPETGIAIRAWAADRLVLARAGTVDLPAGLRDIPAIDFTGARVDAVLAIGQAVAAHLPGPPPETPASAAASAPMAAPRRSSPRRIAAVLAAIAVILITVKYISYPSRLASVQTSTGSFPHVALDRGPPGLGSPNAVPPAAGAPVPADTPTAILLIVSVAAGVAIVTAIGLAVVWRRRRRRPMAMSTPVAEAVSAPAAVPASPDHVFVSYSRRDQMAVDQIVVEIESSGLPVWIDRRADPAGSGRYAAPIVAAIKSSRVIALMCSRNSFESDHVIREIYVAGDFKKPFIAFELDPTEMPDELRYFLSGFPRVPAKTLDPDSLRVELARLVG